MAGANRRVADFQAVDNFIGFLDAHLVETIVERGKIGAIPAKALIELLHHSPANGLAAHIHGYKTGSEERTILVTIDLLENQPQHRSVDDALVLLLDLGRPFRAEIVGIKKLEQVGKRIHTTATAFSLGILQHSGAIKRQIEPVFQFADP